DTAGFGYVYSYINNSEIPGLGYSAGITTSYQLGQNWSLDAGVKYALNRYRTKEITFTDAQGEKIGTGYYATLNRFISIPIGIHRSFTLSGHDRIGFMAGVSIIPQYSLGVWTRGNYDLPEAYDNIGSYSKDEITTYNQFTAAGSVEAGVNMCLDKICIQVLPNFTYNFMKQAQDVKINKRLWSAGLEIRVLYSI
ncbi:MAG TPA: outer membrane beta-barrel protein, partial [Bacteroidia bacterium]|nr:outer membrane beta-barrel protein [Bacteroidia bacterium]